MATYLISDYYESKAIRQHYHNRESLAVSFLMAMGSKALALTELSEVVSISGLDCEANCAHELIRDRFRSRLREVGLLVNKRARNGHLRIIQITLQCSKQGDHIEWQSKTIFGGKKTFSLNNLISIHSSEKANINSSEKSYSEKTATPKSEVPTASIIRKISNSLMRVESENSITRDDSSIPFITLINNTRKLDLRFQTEKDSLIYIDLIRHYYITNSSTISTPVA
jgi:hypothetical protein